MPRHKDIRKYLGDYFLEDLIKECDKIPYGENQDLLRQRNKALVATIFLTGGSIERVLTLKKRNFEFREEERKRRNAFFVKEMPIARQKETRTFRIFYDDLLVEHLLNWIDLLHKADDYLFPSGFKKGEPLGREQAYNIINRLGERRDFPIAPTDLRVQRMYYLSKKRGFKPIDVQKYLGMKTLPMIFRHKPSTTTSKQVERDMKQVARTLGFNTNWFLATCALQLQEVAITLVAKRKNIKLDQSSVEKILGKKIEHLSFRNQYEAFRRITKKTQGIEMPKLTMDFRRMRALVLHEGYPPEPEETAALLAFTTGLLKKLKTIV